MINFGEICGNHSGNYFHIKMFLKLIAKTLATQWFFIDHLKTKTVNKTTSRRSQQITSKYANDLGNFPTGAVIFRDF